MKSQDIVYVGAPIGPALAAEFLMKGYRVCPVLGAGATIADVVAAYAPLRVQVTRNSQSRALSGLTPGVVDDIPINGPDWVRNPGYNLLLITAGQVGTTYRVWWAEDCFEIVDAATPPYLNGMAPGTPTGSSTAPAFVGPAGAVTQLPASAANIPTLATDGLALPGGARGVRASISAVVGQTLAALGATTAIVWWRYDALVGRWQETEAQNSYPVGRRDASTVEQVIATAATGDRIFPEARQVAVSGGATLQIGLTVS